MLPSANDVVTELVNLSVSVQVDHRDQNTPVLIQVSLDLGSRFYESLVCDTIDFALANLISKLPKSIVCLSFYYFFLFFHAVAFGISIHS
jgi:hypothetical protein